MTNALRENAIRETRTKSRLPKDQTKADLAAACEAERAAMRRALCAQLPLPSQGQVARGAGTAAVASRTAMVVAAAAKRPRLGAALPPARPPPHPPAADAVLGALTTRLLGACERMTREGAFLMADDAEALRLDGWDAALWSRVAGGLVQLQAVLRARSDGAGRLVRRGGALVRLGADRLGADRLGDGADGDGAGQGADYAWMSGAISAPLELSPVAAGGGAPRRRFVTACGSPRMECLGRMKGSQIKAAFAHCVEKGRRRTRHAAGLQARAQPAAEHRTHTLTRAPRPTPLARC